jgi:hypothetical protein
MIWTEQAISDRLDLMLAEAIMLDRVSGWPSERFTDYKISLRHTWAKARDRKLRRTRTGKTEFDKAAYMRAYMARRREKRVNSA